MGIGQNWVPQINSMVVLKISTFQSLVQVHFDPWIRTPLSNHHWISLIHWWFNQIFQLWLMKSLHTQISPTAPQMRMGNISHCSSWKQLPLHISCSAKHTAEGPQRLALAVFRGKSPNEMEVSTENHRKIWENPRWMEVYSSENYLEIGQFHCRVWLYRRV